MKIKKLANLIAVPIILGITCVFPIQQASADDICDNTNISAEIRAAAGCPNVSNVSNLQSVITNILNSIIAVSGIVAVIFIIIGGINYMTSSGDSAKVQKAKNTILYACIGLIICALAFAIVNWVIVGVIGAAEEI